VLQLRIKQISKAKLFSFLTVSAKGTSVIVLQHIEYITTPKTPTMKTPQAVAFTALVFVLASTQTTVVVAQDIDIITTTSPTATQICPISILENSTISACQEWQTASQSNYDCTNDDYLATFTPGQYEGVIANYLSFNTAQSTGHFVDRAKLFEKCTGGTINFAEATDIAEDPIKDIGSASSIGVELYDAYLMIYSFTSEASSLGLLETLNDRIRSSNSLLKYEDIFPKVRNMGEYRKDGKTVSFIII
jgi:hypothetical protein